MIKVKTTIQQTHRKHRVYPLETVLKGIDFKKNIFKDDRLKNQTSSGGGVLR